MLETHNYSQIHFQAQPRHLKPPGIYWLQATAVRLLSSAEATQAWPYRLPSVLGALLAVLLTFWLGCHITHPKTAGLAALFLACSVLLMIEAHLAVTDAVLLTTMVAMQAGLAKIYLNAERPHWFWPFLFWVAMAAGIFIKGITPLIGGLTILGLYFADRRHTAWIKALRLSWGIPLLLLLTAAWLIPFSLAAGHNFLWDMIKGDMLPKLAGGQQSHGMPPGYFTLLVTPLFWPASLFIVPAAWWAWRHRQDVIVRFLLAWILPTWIFFEIVPTKLPEYVLPVYPAIALLIALALANREQIPMPKWLQWVHVFQQIFWGFCTLALAAALICAGGWGWLAAALALVAGGYLFYLKYSRFLFKNYPAALAVGVFIAAGAFIPVWQFILPNIASIWLSNQFATLINNAPADVSTLLNPVMAVDYQEPSLVFLLGNYRVQMTRSAEAIANAAQKPQTLMLISQENLPCITALMAEKNLLWRPLARVKGFNYNQRRQVAHYLILTSGIQPSLPSTHSLADMAANSAQQSLFCGGFINNFRSPDRSDSVLISHYFPIVNGL